MALMQTGSSRQSRFLYLDGMRGIAALFIALLHGLQTLARTSGANLPNAALAVDFFFCLSGFVIALSYGDKLRQGMPRRDFITRRAIRLLPVLFIGLLSGGAIAILQSLRHGGGDLAETLVISALSLLMLPAGLLFGKQAFPTDNPVWSLLFEILTNLAFAIIRVPSRVFGLLLTALLAILLGAAIHHFGSVDRIGFDTPLTFLAGFARVGYSFAAGALIHRFYLFRNRGAIWSRLGLIALAVLLAWPVGSWLSDVVAIIAVLPIIVIAGTAQSGRRIAPFLAILGELSYPFYIIHMPLLTLFTQVPGVWALAARMPLVAIGLWIILAAACALALSRLYDLPLRRWLSAFVTTSLTASIETRRRGTMRGDDTQSA